MIASASMLLAAPAVDNATAQTSQKGMYVMTKGQGQMMGMMKNRQGMNGNPMKQKMIKQKMKMNSPFLIKHGLPHLTKMIMPYMNDPAFNLTAEQKNQLAKVRVDTMSAIMEAKAKVIALRKEIVNASAAGVSSADLKERVAKLALLEAAATMTHLKCIEDTKAILTKDQLYFLLTNKSKKMNHGQKKMGGKGQPKMMIMKMKQQQSMKCAQGKCGQGMGK
jgi:hypothetical protein